MANKAILDDGESYICPYCDAVDSLLATVDAVHSNVRIYPPDDWSLSDGDVESSVLVCVECESCGRVWDAEDGEVRFAPVKE